MICYVVKNNSYTCTDSDLITSDYTDLVNRLKNSSISHGITLYITDSQVYKMFDYTVSDFIDYVGEGGGSSASGSITWSSKQW